MRGKMIWTLSGVVLIAAILLGSTLAFFTAATDATNVVAIGNVKVRATLEGEVDRELEVLRGKPYQTNSTRIQNHGSTNAYIRARLVPEQSEQAEYYSQLEVRGSAEDGDLIKYENGWYYYKQALIPVAEGGIPLLLEGWFTVDKTTVQTDLVDGVVLLYEVQAIQQEYIPVGDDGYPVWPADDEITPNYK